MTLRLYFIEYETRPLRGIYFTWIKASSKQKARKVFSGLNPRSRIREIVTQEYKTEAFLRDLDRFEKTSRKRRLVAKS